jgi:LL-diaminopimelate aminotransferase
VEYAIKANAVILYDAAYEYFIESDALARSIFEVEGARECAIEFCSFSKTAGFTGVRCGYTIIPKELVRGGASLNRLWARRQSTKFNGVSYISQMGAAEVFTDEGEREIRENIAYYKKNAATVARCLDDLNIFYTGGKNSPYLWLKCPRGMNSWEFFDYLLENANVVGTPGSGFGKNGDGFFRLTAFGDADDTKTACERIARLLK